jgi:hypothetical protein
MRTTLTLDDQVARDLKQLANRTGKALEVVVNETLRAGLAAEQQIRRKKRYRLRAASLGGLLLDVNLDRALSLADALEDEELTRKLDLRK